VARTAIADKSGAAFMPLSDDWMRLPVIGEEPPPMAETESSQPQAFISLAAFSLVFSLVADPIMAQPRPEPGPTSCSMSGKGTANPEAREAGCDFGKRPSPTGNTELIFDDTSLFQLLPNGSWEMRDDGVVLLPLPGKDEDKREKTNPNDDQVSH